MTEQTLVTDAVETGDIANAVDNQPEHQEVAQEQPRMFSQDEVNAMIAKRAEKMAKQKFGDIDVEEYKSMKAAKEKAAQDDLIRKQKFEEVLKQQKQGYEDQIATLQGQLKNVRVDGAVLDAASKLGAVSPQHVAQLMKESVQLDSTGNAVVVDGGEVRYDPTTAEPMTVESAVQEFLEQNPYFRSATPAGAGSKSNTAPKTTEQLTLKDLDMKNPEHRKIYGERMKMNRTRNWGVKQ